MSTLAELLREAREAMDSLGWPADYEICRRIDQALAEHDNPPQVSHHCPICEARAREERTFGWGVVDREGCPVFDYAIDGVGYEVESALSEDQEDAEHVATHLDIEAPRRAPHRVVPLTWTEDT